MSVRRVQNPGEEPSRAPSALATPCMCWHSWGVIDPFETDLREQGRQMMIRGEAMRAAGQALREAAEREEEQRDQRGS